MCIYVLTSIHKPLLLTWPSIMGWDYFYSALLRVWAQCVTLKLQEQLSEPKERCLLLTIHTEVNVPLALPRSVDCHTRVCPRVTELGTGQCQHPAPRQDLQQEHSTFRHIPMLNTGGGTPRAPFKTEHLFCHCFPPSLCTPVFSSNPDLKSRTPTSCQSPRNSWHCQDFAGSGHPSLTPASNMLSHF